MLATAKENLIRQKKWGCSTKRILLLDDEPYNIEALKFIFKAIRLEGFPDNASFFYDAQEALE